MRKIYFLLLFAFDALSTQADNLREVVESYCATSPELYQEVMPIIDSPTLTSEEKITQLCRMQSAARADLEGKIQECIDIYTDVSMDLQERSRGFMVIDELKDRPPMSISQSSDVFKKRLLDALRRLDASAGVILAFSVCANNEKEEPSLLNIGEKTFFARHVSFFLQKKVWISTISVGLLAIYGIVYKKIAHLKHKALNKTPLSEWLELDASIFGLQRWYVLGKIVTAFPNQDKFSEQYESVDGVTLYTSSVETFLVAVRKEEGILRRYITWQSWAERFFLSWLLPISRQETSRIKNKLKHIVTMQEII